MASNSAIVRLEPGDEQWATAIANGAPPFERLQHPAFRFSGRTRRGTEAARCWIDAICDGSPPVEAQLLKFLRLDYSDVMQAFGPAQLAAEERLPPWAECLIQTIRALPENQPKTLAGQNPTVTATQMFFDVAARLLDWDALRVRYPFLHPGILASLTTQLATRILLACGATLELENTANSEPMSDFSRRAWMVRLCGFTGLNFVVGTAIRQWKQNAIETLNRAAQDLPLLYLTLLKGTSRDLLVAIEGDLGDRHNDGRSVAVLTFESGRRVVYKPKDLRCAYQFLDLLAFLNADARSINLPTRQILCRGSYAWEEYVDERVAVIDAEVSSFFKRFGMFLRVLQLVEGRDFWLDNLRICGGLPIFVDLECILHPRLRTEGVGRLIMGLEPEVYQESVLPTAAVTHPIDIPGGGRQDFGGLSSPGPRLLPLGVWSGYRDQKNGNFWLQQGRIYWNPELAWPQPDGKLANPVAYLDELESGYRETQLLLCQRASGLLGPASPLAGMSNVPVRVLMRSTWEYLVLLRASLEPTALLDGNARELALANVLSSSPTWGGGDDGGRRLAISCSELIALRTLDIPQFYSLPSSTSVMDTSHSEIADVFDGTADDRLRRRLTEVDSFDIETHARILRDAVNSIARG